MTERQREFYALYSITYDTGWIAVRCGLDRGIARSRIPVGDITARKLYHADVQIKR